MKKKNLAILLALILTASALTACAASGLQSSAQSQTAQAAETSGAQTASRSAQAGTSLSADDAKSIALEHAGVTQDSLIAVKITEDRDDGMDLYDVDFYTADRDYEYEIAKTSGQIMSIDTKIKDLSWDTPSSASFTKEQAMKAVLAKVPGATQDNLRMEAERDDGRILYDGEVVVSDRKYEFEIDAADGTFLEWNEQVFPAQAGGQTGQTAADSQPASSGESQTPENAALQTAMADVGISRDAVLSVVVRPDRDDGRTRYDVEIYAVDADYEYELDETGTRILERERETYDLSWNTPSGASFTKEQAIEAVLAKVPGATRDNLRMKVDHDDGFLLYEGEVIFNDMEYDFEINTGDGTFLEWSEGSLSR